MAVRSPWTPIFDSDRQDGTVVVGNTPAFVSATFSAVGTGASVTDGTLELTLPSFNEGDIGLIHVASIRVVTNDAWTPHPYVSGWELCKTEGDAAGAPYTYIRLWTFWREMQAGDSTSVTVNTPSAGGNASGICYVIANGDPYGSFAEDKYTAAALSGAGTLPNDDGTAGGVMINAIVRAGVSAVSLTSAQDFTFIDNVTGSGTNVNRSVAAAYRELSTGGSIVQPTWTDTGSAVVGSSFNIPVASTPSIGSLATEIAALSPVGYWKLNETSGTTATDSSGNGRNGTYSGSYTLAAVTGGDGDDYVDFGVSARGLVTIADNNVWTAGTAGFTVFCLFRPHGTTSDVLVSKATNPYEWALSTSGTGNGGTFWRSTGAAVTSTFGSFTNSTNTWAATAMVVADTPKPSRPIYVYHSSAKNPGHVGTFAGLTPYSNTTAQVVIGDRGDNNGQFFDGNMAHVFILDRRMYAYEWRRLIRAAEIEGWF